jgi:hypothetical protein
MTEIERLADLGARVSGADLLDELHAAFTKYVAFPSAAAADAVVLWVAATHAQPAWEHGPRLALLSPVKRCGKSRLLDVIEATCHSPLMTVNASVAALVRSITDDPPTLLVDEADTVFGKKRSDTSEDLRGILNAGHQRNRPYLRWDITTRATEHVPTFAMAALAAIGRLPDTIEDRAVIIRMRRRAPGERVQPYRIERDGRPLVTLRDKIRAWVRGHLAQLRDAVPELPIEDRAADTWEPLVAIADAAGGAWPKRARAAAVAFTNEAADEDDSSLGVQLLADLRMVFGTADHLYTTTITKRLRSMDEAPWDDLHGKAIDARKLGELLRPYGVSPRAFGKVAAPR